MTSNHVRTGDDRSRSWFAALLVEPLYRLFYGRLPEAGGSAEADGTGREADRPRGLVLVADGVGGLDLCGTGLRDMAAADRLPSVIEVFSWGHGVGRWFADLTDVANRDRQATRVAEAVRRFQAEQPGDSVFLVGKSGGSGVMIKALEQLDQGRVERVVLLAPALSPGYDLTRALRAVSREMVVFWSPLDVVILGAGTRVFGTIDRVRGVGAGLVGFVAPGPDDPDGERIRQYAKLRQVRWRPGMASAGNLGGHAGPDNPMFLRKYVVPLLRAAEAESVPPLTCSRSARRRIAGRCQANLPLRRYPYGPGHAGLTTRRTVAPGTLMSETVRASGTEPIQAFGLADGASSWALWSSRDHFGRSSLQEPRRAPSRTGTLMPHRAAVSAFSNGRISPPAPHNGGRDRLAFDPFHSIRASTSGLSFIPDRPEADCHNIQKK